MWKLTCNLLVHVLKDMIMKCVTDKMSLILLSIL